MMTRILFFSVLLLIIDFLAFQAVRHLLSGSGKSVKTIVYIVYWIIPVVTLIYLAGFSTGWSEHLPKAMQVTIRSMIFIFYFAKLLIAAIILIDDLRRLLFRGYEHGLQGLESFH